MFLVRALEATRSSSNGWTLHSRMEMEELGEVSAFRLSNRENKAVEMENVCHLYKEGLDVSFTVMINAALKC